VIMNTILNRTFSSDASKKWLRYLIIIGVIFVSIVIGRMGPDFRLLLAMIALPILVLGTLALLRWPPLGLLLVIVASVVIRIEIPPIGIVATVLAGLTGLWIFDMVVRQREIKLVPSPTVAPLIMFTAVTILAFIVGQLPWFSVSQVPIDNQIGGMAIFILSFAAFLLVAHQVRDIRWLKWMTYLFIALSAPAIFVGMRILPAARQINQLLYNAKTVGGSLFWLWLVALSFSQALFNRKLSMRWRIVLGIITLANLSLSLGRNRSWTSGWAPSLVAIGVVIWVARPKWAMPLTMIGLAGLIVAFQPLYNAVFIGDNEYSAVTRLEAWRIMWEIIKVNPILGVGPGNYYNYTVLFPILGWYVEFNSHNNYVDIVAQTGVLGLICFIWFVIVVGRLGWHLRNRVPKGGFTQAYVYACLGALGGTVVAGMLGDWVLPFVYNIGIFGLRSSIMAWLFLGGLVAIDQMVKMKLPLD